MFDMNESCEQMESLLEWCYAYSWQTALSTKRINHSEVQQVVSALYRGVKEPPPVVIWCDSPWQLLTMPIVLQLMNVTSDARWVPEWLRANIKDELWRNLWRAIDEQKDAVDSLFASRQSCGLPSFFSPLITGRHLAADMDHLLYLDTSEPNHDGFSEAEHSHIQAQTRDKLRDDVQPMKRQMMQNVFQQVATSVPRDLTTSLNRQIRSQSLTARDTQRLVRMTAANTGNAANAVKAGNARNSLMPHAAIRAVAADISPQLTGEQRRELESWIRSQLDLQLRMEADNLFWAGGWGTYYLTQLEFYARNRARSRDTGGTTSLGATTTTNTKTGFHRWQPLSRYGPVYLFFEKVAFVCERPVAIQVDDEKRLHCETAAALAYRDGYEIYSWHGRTVPKQVIVAPETITASDIINERNLEVRQIMMDRLGIGKFLQESGAKKYDESEWGSLWLKYLEDEPEPLVFVEVVNSTAEPDGTFKHYFLRVPPQMSSARQAIAWTFGMQTNDYSPLKQT